MLLWEEYNVKFPDGYDLPDLMRICAAAEGGTFSKGICLDSRSFLGHSLADIKSDFVNSI